MSSRPQRGASSLAPRRPHSFRAQREGHQTLPPNLFKLRELMKAVIVIAEELMVAALDWWLASPSRTGVPPVTSPARILPAVPPTATNTNTNTTEVFEKAFLETPHRRRWCAEVAMVHRSRALTRAGEIPARRQHLQSHPLRVSQAPRQRTVLVLHSQQHNYTSVTARKPTTHLQRQNPHAVCHRQWLWIPTRRSGALEGCSRPNAPQTLAKIRAPVLNGWVAGGPTPGPSWLSSRRRSWCFLPG